METSTNPFNEMVVRSCGHGEMFHYVGDDWKLLESMLASVQLKPCRACRQINEQLRTYLQRPDAGVLPPGLRFQFLFRDFEWRGELTLGERTVRSTAPQMDRLLEKLINQWINH